jgi:hypothetical protein
VIATALEEIMKMFDLPRLIQIHHRIAESREYLDSHNEPFDEEDAKRWLKFITEVKSYCDDAHFHHASDKAFGLQLELEGFPEIFTGATFLAHLEGLRSDIDICMFAHRYAQVVGDSRGYLDAKALFGEPVLTAFPDISQDVQDAGNAIAVDLGTAAVFHLMRAVEWGLRAFAIDVGLSDVVVNKKKRDTVPLAYSEWEKILNQLPEKIDEKIEPIPRGEEKQKAQEFYYSSASEVRAFKDAWRNHVMHTRRSYTTKDAVAVFSHIQRFMQGLAAHGIKTA